MKYELLNLRAENDNIVAFFRFGNGIEHSNRFNKKSKIEDLLTWADKHGKDMKQAEEDYKRSVEELLLQANLITE